MVVQQFFFVILCFLCEWKLSESVLVFCFCIYISVLPLEITTITLASKQQSPSPQIHIEQKKTATTHDDGHFAWDCTKLLRPEPVNGIPILSPLIKGSPTAIQIYKYKSKIQVQIRLASTHKENTISQKRTSSCVVAVFFCSIWI
jgi:hypothetical protein